MTLLNDKLTKIDNYEQTVQAIVSFCHFLKFDYNANFSIGRKMKTSQNNKHSKNEEIAPDLISNIDNYGLVCEVKKEFSKEDEHWLKEIQQLEKYDDDLSGWDTSSGNIATHDIVLLTHYLRSRKVKDHIKKLIDKKQIEFKRNYSIIEFTRNDERNLFYNLRLEDGELAHKEINNKLYEGKGIPFEKLIKNLASVKFYDGEPETEYVMAWLWTGVFNTFPEPSDYRSAHGKTIEIEVSVDKAFKLLRQYYGPPIKDNDHQVQIPKKKWVKKALDNFVTIKLAKQTDENNYIVKFHQVKKQKEFLVGLIEKLEKANQQKTLKEFETNL